MAVLATVAQYITRARVLLQDTSASAYRYSDVEIMEALNLAVLEARRIRPDLFLSTSFVLPEFTTTADSTAAIDNQYRSAFLYYAVGHCQLRDDESTQDARAQAFLNVFKAQLTT